MTIGNLFDGEGACKAVRAPMKIRGRQKNLFDIDKMGLLARLEGPRSALLTKIGIMCASGAGADCG